ncbi:hypothetical protein THRCLA_03417 [Thraustotheca clavata]|uniref:Peroxisomal membrane protein PEX14 n=1 Tax=Thraustotheca clavata TaxID=74557 RepID=A0A1W0A225_9STRA|nr:hypothetical protein THRCLA_03417 [Thraustotheca clavata]
MEESSSIDGEKVNSGVRFLSHPDVQATPLSERLAFLENKGLSRAEINAAVEKHHQSNIEIAKKEVAPAPPSSLWSILFPLAGTTAVLGFLWKFMQYDESQKLEEVVAMAAEYTRPVSNETALVQAIQAQTAEMMKLMSVMQLESQERRELVSKQSNTNQSIAELRSELASLKAMINELKTQDYVKSPKISKELQPINKPVETVAKDAIEDAEVEFKKKAQAMLDALKQVEIENNADIVKQAASILIMYTKNLVEQPNVPRYRRIATGNANFKQKIEPLKHHLALLTSIGFEKVGMSMEWKWHSTPSYTTNLTILKAAIHAFESAVANDGEVLSVAAESYLSSNAPNVLVDNPNPSSQEEAKTPDLNSFLMKLKQPKVSELTEDEPATEPSYPESFTEVMKMVQNGEEVPGIRKIEDKLSEESQDRLSSPVEELPANKPWSI